MHMQIAFVTAASSARVYSATHQCPRLVLRCDSNLLASLTERASPARARNLDLRVSIRFAKILPYTDNSTPSSPLLYRRGHETNTGD